MDHALLHCLRERAYYCAFTWSEYRDNPISVLYIWNGGLAIYGAVLGAIVGVIVFCRVKKVKLGAVLDIVALGFLIGHRGDTLDAIQHLANYAVGRTTEEHIRICVDAENYRMKREEGLRRYARKKAMQVLKARRRTTLEPMNAYERHVIHAALQDMDNITTHSTGVEPNRRVVIEYVR